MPDLGADRPVASAWDAPPQPDLNFDYDGGFAFIASGCNTACEMTMGAVFCPFPEPGADAPVDCILGLPFAPLDTDNVVLRFVDCDGGWLERSQDAGDWDYANSQQAIELFGQACDVLRTGRCRQLRLLAGCGCVPFPPVVP